jgi:phospholipase/carboxylesterase
MNFQPLKYIYKPSAKPGAYTLLLLHGTGGNEADLIPLAENFGNGFNILSVRGNVSENGMPRFFRRLGMGIFDEEDLRFRTDELVAFVKRLATNEGFDANKVIALGYSNGANIAGATLVKHPGFLAGAIMYRPMPPFKELNIQGKVPQVPVLATSGAMDGTVNREANQKYINTLQEAGFNVEYHMLPSGHNLTQQDLAFTDNWLKKFAV